MALRVTMDFFQHRYYRTPKFLMTIIGQWPYQTLRTRRRSFAFVIILVTSQAIPLFLALAKHYENRDMVLDCLSAFVYATWCVAKLVTFRVRSEKMLKMLNRIRADWLAWSDDREIKILHQYADQGQKFTIVYTVAFSSVYMIYLIQPVAPHIIGLLMGNDSSPRRFLFPVDYYNLDTQKYYFCIILHMYVCIPTILIISATYDIMLVIYVQHGCAIFTAVGHKFKRIGEIKRSVVTGEILHSLEQRNTVFEHLIFLCIARHNDAIEFAKLIEATYTWNFFVTVVLRILIICMTGLQIVTKINEPHETARFVAVVISLVMYVYMESYIAQILMDHSTSIRYYILKSQWYTLSLKAQKLLLLVTMRCNIPCQLTAGKMIHMSVESFAMFLKTATSYVTVLRSM